MCVSAAEIEQLYYVLSYICTPGKYIYIYYILGHEWEIGMRKETLMQMQDKLYWENMREKENG